MSHKLQWLKTLKVSRKSFRCVRRYFTFYMLVECPVYLGEGNHKNGVNTATLQLRYSFTHISADLWKLIPLRYWDTNALVRHIFIAQPAAIRIIIYIGPHSLNSHFPPSYFWHFLHSSTRSQQNFWNTSAIACYLLFLLN